jgi:hypothetical protein
MSPDHRTSFTVADVEGRSCFRIAGAAERCHDGLSLDHIVYSPDSRHVAYAAREGDRWRVIRDGVADPPVDDVGELVFSADGRHLAYSGRVEADWRVVRDSRAAASFDSIVAGSLVFSSDGRLAYAGRRLGTVRVVVDDVPGSAHSHVGEIVFSPDGARVAYVAYEEPGATSPARLVLDGIAGEAYDAISEIVFSPSGEPAMIAERGDEWWVVTPNAELGPHRAARNLRLRATDGAPIYVAGDGQRERLIVDGVEHPSHTRIEGPAMSGRDAWGYVGQDSSRSTVVIEGRTHSVEDWARDLTFDESGERHAFVSQHDGRDAVVHDRGSTSFDLVVDGTLQFLGEGGPWACLAGDWTGRRLYVAVEGIRRTRAFQWDGLPGVVRSGSARDRDQLAASLAALRAWVAAEAALILEDERAASSPAPSARPPS